MKKAISALLFAAVLAGAFAFAAPVSTHAALYKPGDANGDCK